ncbi:MAG: NifB/NifX family molybdenum-iron cluster-binding protein [Thermodesulfobacteriota bacterium]
MKILITSTGPNLDAMVDPRFGRTAWFLIIDSETGELLEAIDNQAGQDAAQGAGISAAAMVADKGVKRIYTGRLGPKAMDVINRSGIDVIDGISGSVGQVLARVNDSPGSSTTTQGQQGNSVASGEGMKRQCRGDGKGKGRGRGMGNGRGPCRL